MRAHVEDGAGAVFAGTDPSALLETVGIALWEWHPDTDTLTLSSAALPVTGALHGGKLQLPVTALYARVHPADQAALRAALEQHKTTGARAEQVFRLRGQHGQLRWVRMQIQAAAQHGASPNCRGLFQDITEAHRDAQIVAAFFGQSQLLHLAADSDGNIYRVNQAWEQILSLSPEALLGSSVLALIHPEDIAATREQLARLASGASVEAFENRYRHADGSYRLINWSANVTPDTSMLYAIGRDVTEERTNNQQLAEAAAVFHSTGEGVLITDIEGRIQDVNNAFTEITGYTRAEALGRNTELLASGRHSAAFFEEMWSELARRGSWRGELWNRRKNGEIYPQLSTLSAVRAPNGEIRGYVSVFSDISAMKKTQEELQFLAHHDPLTELPNRELMKERLAQGIARSRRSGNKLALMFLDLDGFKNVNDSLGHLAGDKLLQQASQRLVEALRAEDTIARVGGDEFVVMIEGLQHDTDVSQVADKIIGTLRAPFQIEGRDVSVTGSLGISLFPDDGESVTTLMRNADSAMYSAKDGGRDKFHFYSQHLTTRAFEHVLLDNALRVGLERQEFRIAYQPQVNLANGQIIGLEALVRWQHPAMGTVSPGRFIPHAERCGLITSIGNWVLENACLQGALWLEQGLHFGHIAVNVAAPQFASDDFLDTVSECLRRSGLPPGYLELEITESILLRDSLGAIQRMRDLKALGVTFSIDDFGTGYSSLSYLNKMPIDRLKLDRSFVQNITTETNDRIIAESVIALGKAMQIRVLAEGIETQQQAELLFSMGCVDGQGFRYSIPLYPDRLEPFLFRHCRRS